MKMWEKWLMLVCCLLGSLLMMGPARAAEQAPAAT